MSIIPADVLVHLSNILLLIAYSVRDILWLRWFAVAAAVINIPYYLLQSSILWPPVAWGAVFAVINLYQIIRIYWERRPVVMSGEEKALYDLGFQALGQRDFVSLTMIGEWRNAAAGEKLMTVGERVTSICIPISGAVHVRRQGRDLGTITPGQAIGTAMALLGEPSAVDAVVTEPTRYLRWPLAGIRAFLDQKPELRATLVQLTNQELARKMHQATSPDNGTAARNT
jgi:Popeye protein conserved region